MDPKLLAPATLALHAGQLPDPATGARAVPIFQTAAYVLADTEHAAGLFNLERPGHIDGRTSNPTVAVLEERIAALEGGTAAVAAASGQAALHLAVATLMGAGAHIVAARNLRGGYVNLLGLTLPRFGIATSFVDPRDPAAFAAAIRPETRLVLAGLVGDPGLEVPDLPRLAEIAHDHGLPLAIDNTLATPHLCRPIEHGADIVLHAAGEWLGGHGIAVGGVLVDGGRFDWQGSDRFPTMSEPHPGWEGLVFAEAFGTQAFAARARLEGLRDFGAVMSPETAFHLLLGVETLPLRMERHLANTARVLDFLAAHPAVAYVLHPSRPDHPDHAPAQRLLSKGAAAIVSFGVEGGRAAAARFIEGCRLAAHLAHAGDARTAVIHPASTTHRPLGGEQGTAMGVRDDMIRLSVGLEDPDDIVADLDRALRAAQKG